MDAKKDDMSSDMTESVEDKMEAEKTYTIDRFEEDKAVLEDEKGDMTIVDRDQLPASAKEGDLLVEREGQFLVDAQKTADRRKEIQAKFDSLFD